MGKRSRKETEAVEKQSNGIRDVKSAILVDDKAVDPTLALLFASSVKSSSREENTLHES
jgi:nucleolar protein 12